MTTNNISILIGLKNNLEYTKFFYEQTRSTHPELELCFVSYGSTDGTNEWLQQLKDKNVKFYISAVTKTLADAYNKATELATKDYVVYAHNDMILAKDFAEKLSQHLEPNRVVCYTTIEPPVFSHHQRTGKIIEDMGSDISNFQTDKFYSYSINPENPLVICDEKNRPSFFMCCAKQVLLDIGGMDNLFDPFFCEDDDILRRLKLYNMQMAISLDAYCYHFVSKTSRFSSEFENSTRDIEFKSQRNYIRKWGTRVLGPKYKIAAKIINPNMELLYHTEIFFDKAYTDNQKTISEYVKQEQPNTKYDLSNKIKHTDEYVDSKEYSVLHIDGKKFDKQDFQFIVNIMNEIERIGKVETVEAVNMKLEINNLEDHQKELIKNV